MEPFMVKFSGTLSGIFIFLGLLSIIVGGLFGLSRNRVWQILGASGIVNMGFCILALVPGEMSSLVAASTYLVCYMLLSFNFVTFLLAFIRRNDELCFDKLRDLHIVDRRDGGLVLLFVFNNFALAGMPPFTGFLTKALVCYDLFFHGFTYVAIIALYGAAFSTFMYLNLISHAYFKPNLHHRSYFPVQRSVRTYLVYGTIVSLIAVPFLPYAGVWVIGEFWSIR